MRTEHLRPMLIVLAVLLALPLLPGTATAEANEETVASSLLPFEIAVLYFEPTGHNLAGGFLRYWWEHGQVGIFGYPITEELTENGRTVQYFERARFEYFPEFKGTPYEVQLGHLGRQLVERRAEPAFRPIGLVADTPDQAYFEATGHSVAYAFKSFWEANDGLMNFGYPLSEEFSERGRVVQYFERARFEYFPEHVGTPYEVQLGHLGRQLAQARELPQVAAGQRSDATVWSPTLPEDIVLNRVRQAALTAVPSPVTPFQAVLTVPSTELRRAPTTIAPAVGMTYARHLVQVVGVAEGEPVGGDSQWYQVAPSGAYVPAGTVKPFTPPAPPQTWAGRWVDVNLSTFYITAYEGAKPLYSAIITAGRDDRTPKGIFYVQRRVRSETMDSATVGFPKGHPEYYYLKNVEYTQYFLPGGFAIHGNYWVHPSRFGAFSSNGCVGLMTQDAAYFWGFATVGTPIHIHF